MKISSLTVSLSAGFVSARSWAAAHMYMASLIVVVVLGGGYYVYAKATSTEGQSLYTVGAVEKTTIIASVSASGQVSSSNQLDLTADVSGNLTYVGVKPGQKIGTGAVIARVDSADAQRALRDALTNVENAKLSLEKLQKPASGLTLTQAQNALASAQDSKTTAQENVQKAYSDAYGDIVSVFLDAPDMIASLEGMLIATEAGRSQWNIDVYANAIAQSAPQATSYRNDAYDKFIAAKASYNSTYANYQKFGTTPTSAETDAMLSQTAEMLEKLSTAIRSTEAFIRLYTTTVEAQNRTVLPSASDDLSELGGLNTKAATHVGAITGDVSTLKSTVNSLASADRSITEKQQSLADVQDGPDELDVRTAELTLRQREDAVLDARATLADYSIRAPFSGTIASVTAKAGQRISNGGAVATLVTDKKIATLSLNEVDATKVSLGDKATLTFDALEDLTLTGEVAEIDTIGEVTQGVVSYEVKISFDSQDERVKPGMTVNASIQTDAKTDVLSVPSSAVKTQNGSSYVLVFDPVLDTSAGAVGIAADREPARIDVETGITDDTNIEILSGLTEGQQIVVRTTTGGATTNTTTSRAGGAGGGQVRMAAPAGGAVRF